MWTNTNHLIAFHSDDQDRLEDKKDKKDNYLFSIIPNSGL